MEESLLQELLLNISTLASIYHKPPQSFIGGIKTRGLPYGMKRIRKKSTEELQKQR